MNRIKWVNQLAVLMTMCMMLIGCTGGVLEETATEDVQMRDLLENKMQYVSDRTQLVTLIDLLPMPAGINHLTTTVETSDSSNGVAVDYEVFHYDGISPKGYIEEAPFFRSAVILLSLIENADFVTYHLVDKQSEYPGAEYSYTITRETADEQLGYAVLSQTDSLANFELLLADIESKIVEMDSPQ
ncbi:DUF4825 domain-containing protein [Fusibacter paucivorans]|uniref:DUF4825 domain-containing protein n=1 Tax=Fusibacter paucivorans TaxID=76009 RepID=A0ABS5PM35_9FIRM|nr:DUF4825 domain-containing protein [Fusibacter paucivorans]MBS7525426.1 DUF4825 domain-containing protein [Fusibacter paucivorans]